MVTINEIFVEIKNGIYSIEHLTTKEQYFFIKAHQIVDRAHYSSFWNDGRSKQPLIDLLKEHYPPLAEGHSMENGYEGLNKYVEEAKKVF